MLTEVAPNALSITMATETKTEIVITPGMTAAGLKVLRQSGAIEHSTGAIEVLVADIYKAMALAGYGNVAVEVTVPGVLEPGAEMNSPGLLGTKSCADNVAGAAGSPQRAAPRAGGWLRP
jgi:hypothetical protein